MKISNMRVNHIKNPIGYSMNTLFFKWLTEHDTECEAFKMRLTVALDEDMQSIVFDSGIMPPCNCLSAELDLYAQTRYYWSVETICGDGQTKACENAFFETAKEEKNWTAVWIRPDTEEDGEVYNAFTIEKNAVEARLYISGVGLYEAYLDGNKIGDEYFTPGFNNYDDWIQFQTYCIEKEALAAGRHELKILLGSGWYKGRYMSFDVRHDRNRYGDHTAALAELHIKYEDGNEEVIATNPSWKSCCSKIRANSLYDGEEVDDTYHDPDEKNAIQVDLGYERLQARLSLPVKAKLVVKPKEVIYTPKGETVLDFGQNIVGWLRFFNRLPKGSKCRYQAGEILQDGCFYRDNYRSAKAEFIYTSDGREKWIRPHFTYYGFRYIKLEGFGDSVNHEDFEADVLYSDMEITGSITTGNEKVNQLISNVFWSQRGNFIDLPTDCPQRDERMGWTGDAQVFSMTALYNMDAAAFYKKFVYDMYTEQKKLDGAVPFIVPNICFGDKISSAWGDAATIIPWNLYLMYGDDKMLSEQYPGMKAWVEYIYKIDRESGDTRLWATHPHFGDWLALDAGDTGKPTGGTDLTFIATAFYYLSVALTAKAARALKNQEDEQRYEKLKIQIKNAFQKEYVTENGRLAVDTQTAYVLALYTGLYEEGQEKRLLDGLVRKIRESNFYLKTGFVGTAYLCQVLSKFGRHDIACRLLLNEEYPSWLYCVNLGATTIWERWNSVLPDGHMNPEGMNSLNHYSYGAVLEWMYRYLLGIQPMEDAPGFERFMLNPMPDERLKWTKGSYQSTAGIIVSEWQYDGDGMLHYHFEIPYGSRANVMLGETDGCNVKINDSSLNNYEKDALKSEISFQLEGGTYDISYMPLNGNKKGYSRETDIQALLADEEAKALIGQFAPELMFMPPEMVQGSLEEAMVHVFSGHNYLELQALEEKLQLLKNG